MMMMMMMMMIGKMQKYGTIMLHRQWQCQNSKPIASAAIITSSLVSF